MRIYHCQRQYLIHYPWTYFPVSEISILFLQENQTDYTSKTTCLNWRAFCSFFDMAKKPVELVPLRAIFSINVFILLIIPQKSHKRKSLHGALLWKDVFRSSNLFLTLVGLFQWPQRVSHQLSKLMKMMAERTASSRRGSTLISEVMFAEFPQVVSVVAPVSWALLTVVANSFVTSQFPWPMCLNQYSFIVHLSNLKLH